MYISNFITSSCVILDTWSQKLPCYGHSADCDGATVIPSKVIPTSKQTSVVIRPRSASLDSTAPTRILIKPAIAPGGLPKLPSFPAFFLNGALVLTSCGCGGVGGQAPKLLSKFVVIVSKEQKAVMVVVILSWACLALDNDAQSY